MKSYSTLFWGGETFAPSLKVATQVDGKWVSRNIQVYLQEAFLAATVKLVKAVGDLETVMGFEVSLNCPICAWLTDHHA